MLSLVCLMKPMTLDNFLFCCIPLSMLRNKFLRAQDRCADMFLVILSEHAVTELERKLID